LQAADSINLYREHPAATSLATAVQYEWHSQAIKKTKGADNVHRKEISDQQPQRSEEGSRDETGSEQSCVDPSAECSQGCASTPSQNCHPKDQVLNHEDVVRALAS
jgi:hypothetical protein